MNKTFLCALLMVSCFIKSNAQAPSKEICWAKGSETELKFGLDYCSDAYHLLLKNIKESNNVAKQDDRYVFKTKDGNAIEASLSKEIMSSVSGDGYYSFVLTPKQVDCLSTGLTSIEMIRGGKATSFDLYNYTSSNMQKAAVQVRHDSVQTAKQNIAEEKARQHAEAKQKKKEEYQAWLASRTPEYLATVKNYSYVYGGFNRKTILEKGIKTDSINGVRIGYLYGINLTKRIPLFMELGVEVNYFHAKESYKYEDVKYKVKRNDLTTTIPINISYKYSHSLGFCIQPYIGIDFNYNILSKSKFIEEYEDTKTIQKYDIRDRKFQFGGQVGVRIGYKNIYVGAEYRRLTPYIKHGNGVNVWNVTAGYMF